MTTPITIHELKIWPQFFDPLDRNEKTFEARKNDRGFKVGEILHLMEFNLTPPGDGPNYTGRECWRKITYILHGEVNAPFGVVDGYVILGLGVLRRLGSAIYTNYGVCIDLKPIANLREEIGVNAITYTAAKIAPQAPLACPFTEAELDYLIRMTKDANSDKHAARIRAKHMFDANQAANAGQEADFIDDIKDKLKAVREELRSTAQPPKDLVDVIRQYMSMVSARESRRGNGFNAEELATALLNEGKRIP